VDENEIQKFVASSHVEEKLFHFFLFGEARRTGPRLNLFGGRFMYWRTGYEIILMSNSFTWDECDGSWFRNKISFSSENKKISTHLYYMYNCIQV
jgi:hypothetical protein